MTSDLTPARLRFVDLARLSSVGLRTRRSRAVLSALGITIGVAAMVAIIGISSSSKLQVTNQIQALGPNLLQITAGSNPEGAVIPLPSSAAPAIAQIGPVTSAAQLGGLPLSVYRNDHISLALTGSISVAAVDSYLPTTLHASLAFGSWFTPATMRFPAVVLGATAAQHLGVTAIGTDVRIGDQWCAVLGVLNPIPLAPGIDSSALIGWHAALSYFAFSGHPTTVYARVDQDQLNAVEAIIPRSVSPTTPQSVAVATPSDAIAARVAATSALSSLLIGLAGVALLIGGLGIANTMVVSVLERRSEIGLRRSLGATRAQIRHQFLAESLLLSIMGGVSGTVVGIVVTSAYASERGWPTSVPIWASVGGLVVTAVIGACAGLYPAIRASRVSPTEALTAG